MNIRNFIYFMPIIIFILGIVSIVLALRIKNKKDNKYVIVINVMNIIYLIVISLVIPIFLLMDIELSILITWFISILGGISHLISIIICLLKRKKLNNNSKNKNIFKFALMVLLLPTILFLIVLGKEMYLINHSTILLSYHSSGNGGFGDSNDFTYAINENYCKEISFNIRYNDLFIPKGAKKIDKNELQNLDYKIILDSDNNYIIVYKNNKIIHKEKINKKYFNIDLKEIYYKN